MSLKSSSIKSIATPTPFDVAMMLISLISVVLVLNLAFVPMDAQTRELLFFIDTCICVLFISHFFFGVYRARNKLFYLRHHWIDFVASIPAIEPLRMMRLFQILRVIRLIRTSRSIIIPLLKQRNQTTLASLLVAMVLILSISSVMILLVESGVKGANIHTAQQAIWWSIVTISTVGYGDYYPVTTIGHIIGTLVIICGVSFFGVISGYMASVFVSPDTQESIDTERSEIRTEISELLKKMENNQQQMMQEIAELKSQLPQHQNMPDNNEPNTDQSK